ncbi:hypothetical protein Desde_1071 [Desulfitobacterium dehalogenans ATCC 51507]|uniref:Uncharacterized protein n=1 Tax=Desulfitobacterium dehalogenans (strain ATCC 51507 / DSM 9161 / JW/IU-DC1) TaxID=756499 RepID=I4A6B9_DESDJ|nr:hypothetical protein [Desulfitobacterium dehalogenans]AFL99503.1 hypothetical protein Desde_1071 [Desulfitobacterium dehalogenans ATCC 51507]
MYGMGYGGFGGFGGACCPQPVAPVCGGGFGRGFVGAGIIAIAILILIALGVIF